MVSSGEIAALVFCVGLFTCVPASDAVGVRLTPYAVRSEYALTPPGGSAVGLLGYVNPAVLTPLQSAESLLSWSAERASAQSVNSWGLFWAMPHVGFGVVHRNNGLGPGTHTEYRLAVSSGDRTTSWGVAYSWALGRDGPDRSYSLGTLWRPVTQLSVGGTWTATFDGEAREGAGDIALRPWGGTGVTLFGELARANREAGGDHFWSTGVALSPLPGLVLSGRYLDDRTISIGLRLEFGAAGLYSQVHRNHDRATSGRDRDRGLYSLRLGGRRGSPLDRVDNRPRYFTLDNLGTVRHRRRRLFDDTLPFHQLLELLHRIEKDEQIAAVAVNLSGLRIDSATSWELRQKLLDLRRQGKHIVAYIDRATLMRFHLASAADQIVLDPYGGITLRGFVAGSVYLAGSLDKLGIGAEEWRYHEYKSAFEPFVRTGMSGPEREQLRILLEDGYATVREEISKGRAISEKAFDTLVDDWTLLLPDEALEQGLVDTVGRWAAAGELAAVHGSGGHVDSDRYPQHLDESYGEPPQVVVVYALGLCAMDLGIRARTLSQQIRALGDDNGVEAVVLRVDSPGGDAMASDLVAEAMAEVREKGKPVVVSQSRLSASGGYWISMESDAIVATPLTLTGNIGVVGGWLYDRGFKEHLGLSTDHVKVGEHADLGFGLPLPLFGGRLPDRNVSTAERERIRHSMASLYDSFIGRVANARGLSVAAADSVAHGRIWSGTSALTAGLVDELGGLETAIDLARERAGLIGERIQISEIPRPPTFALSSLGPLIFAWMRPEVTAADSELGEWAQTVRFRLDHNGEPLLLLPELLREHLTFPGP
ncbi:MAG: S49 family peptidase [Candidatus Latescibacterota bacterium]|nr:S49 family peptidase [Candidatus Latescibacterota bacterium]